MQPITKPNTHTYVTHKTPCDKPSNHKKTHNTIETIQGGTTHTIQQTKQHATTDPGIHFEKEQQQITNRIRTETINGTPNPKPPNMS